MTGTVNGRLQTGHHTELNETLLTRGRLLVFPGFFLGGANRVNRRMVERAHILFDTRFDLEPIQEVRIQEQRVGLVNRRSMMRIIARRMKAAADRA